MAVAEVVFWVAAGLLVYTHVGYPLVLALAARRRRPRPPAAPAELPRVSLIVAAHDEEEVIAAKVANALALDYPRELLELIVASDGCADRDRRARPRGRGADLVLELPRAGKVAAQNAAVERASRRAARVLRRERALGARRAARAGGAVRRPGGRLRLRPGASARPGRLEPGGRLLALRDGGPRARVGARPGSPPATAAIYAVRASAYLRAGPGRAATTSRSRSCSPSAAWRAVYAPGGGRGGEDGRRPSRASSPASGG